MLNEIYVLIVLIEILVIIINIPICFFTKDERVGEISSIIICCLSLLVLGEVLFFPILMSLAMSAVS